MASHDAGDGAADDAADDVQDGASVDLDAFPERRDPLLVVGFLAVLAPVLGVSPVTGALVGCSLVGGVLVVQACGQYLRLLARDARRVLPPVPGDRRAQSSARRTAETGAGIVSAGGLVYLVKNYGIGGILYQVFISIIAAIDGLGASFLRPIQEFTDGLARLVAAVFPARIINAAADFTAFSITEGEWAFFGPFTFAVGVIATLAGLYVFMQFLRRVDFSVFGALFDRRR